MLNLGGGVLSADGAPVTIPRVPARDAARRELLNPAYHQHDPSIQQQIMDWLQQKLSEITSTMGLGSNGIVGLVLFLLVAGVIGAALWWRLGAPRRQARIAAGLFAAEGPRTAADHRAAATAHAAAGEWAEAVREQMRALVRALEERTLLDVRPGRTADEAAAEAGRALPAHAEALRSAARTFDDIAYGDHPADQTAYRFLAELDQTLQAARPVLTGAGAGPGGGAV